MGKVEVIIADNQRLNNIVRKPSSLVALVICVWLLDVFLIPIFDSHNENDKENDIKVENQVATPSLDEELMAKDLPNVVHSTYVNLPPAPVVKQAPSETFVPSSPTPSPQPLKTSEVVYSEVEFSQRVEQNYQRLQHLDSNSLSLVLPEGERERSKFLQFMYSCQGMQFGALVENDGQSSLMVLNEVKSVAKSDLLRVAHGSLSAKEMRLLNAYAPNALPVRIFPRQIDLRLSAFIAAQLDGEPLTQFQAVYAMAQNSLQLTDIVVNERFVKQTWVLAKSNCIV